MLKNQNACGLGHFSLNRKSKTIAPHHTSLSDLVDNSERFDDI